MVFHVIVVRMVFLVAEQMSQAPGVAVLPMFTTPWGGYVLGPGPWECRTSEAVSEYQSVLQFDPASIQAHQVLRSLGSRASDAKSSKP
jgi:hypothetical protein